MMAVEGLGANSDRYSTIDMAKDGARKLVKLRGHPAEVSASQGRGHLYIAGDVAFQIVEVCDTSALNCRGVAADILMYVVHPFDPVSRYPEATCQPLSRYSKLTYRPTEGCQPPCPMLRLGLYRCTYAFA